MLICEFEFKEPSNSNSDFSRCEIDFYDLPDYRLSLRRNLKTGMYEVYRRYHEDENDEVIFKSTDLAKSVGVAEKDRNNTLYNYGGFKPHLICDHSSRICYKNARENNIVDTYDYIRSKSILYRKYTEEDKICEICVFCINALDVDSCKGRDFFFCTKFRKVRLYNDTCINDPSEFLFHTNYNLLIDMRDDITATAVDPYKQHLETRDLLQDNIDILENFRRVLNDIISKFKSNTKLGDHLIDFDQIIASSKDGLSEKLLEVEQVLADLGYYPKNDDINY